MLGPTDAAGQRVALVAAATAGFPTPFMGSAVTIALPAIASELMGDTHLTPALYSPFLRSARLAFGVFAVLCGAGVLASLRRGDVR